MTIYKFKFRYVLSNGATGTGMVYSFTVKGVERAARACYHLDDDAKILDIQQVRRRSYGNRRS